MATQLRTSTTPPQRCTSHVNVRTQIVLIGIARPLTSHCLARQVASDRQTGSVCSRELTWKSGEINDTPERGGVDGTRHDSRWWVCASIADAHRRPRCGRGSEQMRPRLVTPLSGTGLVVAGPVGIHSVSMVTPAEAASSK